MIILIQDQVQAQHKYNVYEKFGKYKIIIIYYRKDEENYGEGRNEGEFKFTFSQLTWWAETGGLAESSYDKWTCFTEVITRFFMGETVF